MARPRVRAAIALGFVIFVWGCGPRTPPPRSGATEDAYRANNRGVALLEQLRYPEAAGAFREALSFDSSVSIAQVNLAVALLLAQDLPNARQVAEAATLQLPSAPQPLYLLGLIARAENRPAEARAYFDRVRAVDAADAGASINAAQLLLEEGNAAEAAALLEPVTASEPFSITAAYVRGLALTRAGRVDEGRTWLERAQALRASGYGVTLGTGYLEQGRYAEALASTGSEPDLVDRRTPSTRFEGRTVSGRPTAPPSPGPSTATPLPRDTPFGTRIALRDLTDAGARTLAARLGGALAPLDFDGDGDLDVIQVSSHGQTAWRNDAAGNWTDVTSAAALGPSAESVPVAAVAADIDNDGDADLFVARWGQQSLYRNDRGTFVDITREARLPAYPYLPGAAAFADIDHDGDVDLVVAGLADIAATRRLGRTDAAFPDEFAPAPLAVWRNNRDGTFTDISAHAGLGTSRAVAVVPTDYDNRRDVDLLVVEHTGPPRLLSNQRDGSFRDVTAAAGLSALVAPGAHVTTVTAGDVNKDDVPDFYVAGDGHASFALSDGRGRFTVAPHTGGASGRAARYLDYDADGLLDLLVWRADGPTLFRNVGQGWEDVSAAAFGTPAPGTGGTPAASLISNRALIVGDLDRDGRTDLLANTPAGLRLWHNVTSDPSHHVTVALKGRVSNLLGIGAKVQIRAGSLASRLDLTAASPAVGPADLTFGLGSRRGADTVRVLWPSGIVQAETLDGGLAAPVTVEELDRKPSSCPLLFTWTGERFEFVTDFLGAGEMGYWEAPGQRNVPDPIEEVRIRGDQLRPRDGALELRLTNELEEAVFFDRATLAAIDHPLTVEVFPNAGMTEPAKPEGLHVLGPSRPPSRVTDEDGLDVAALVSAADWAAPGSTEWSVGSSALGSPRVRGYGAWRSLTIDLRGHSSPAADALLLTGWTDYAFSSDNVAAHQAGLVLEPPRLDVRGTDGHWRAAAVAVGIPVGRPQTIVVDLRQVLRPGEHEVRLSSNMGVHWDRVAVARVQTAQVRRTDLDARTATLRVRGFSETSRPAPGAPTVFDYGRVSPIGPWKVLTGHYTREGDVRELLSAGDDLFVITKPGDEIALSFDAAALPAIPDGWTRTYVLRAEGFSKEMDINSGSPDSLAPLPFRAMRRYPYGPEETPPDTPRHRTYRESYNTRQVRRVLPPLLGRP